MVVVPGMIRYGVPSNVVVVAPTILVGANESGMLSTEGNMRNGVSFITVVATPALLNRLLASGISVGPRNSKVWCTIDDCQGSTYTRRSVSERDIAWSWDSDERCPLPRIWSIQTMVAVLDRARVYLLVREQQQMVYY
jgi:hypothetical protein